MTIRSDRSGFGPLFDTADSTAPVDRRTVSTVAPQALFLMNNPFILEQTKALAKRITDGDKDDRARIQRAYHAAVRPAADRGGGEDRRWISWSAAAGRRRRGRSIARCCCARTSSSMWIEREADDQVKERGDEPFHRRKWVQRHSCDAGYGASASRRPPSNRPFGAILRRCRPKAPNLARRLGIPKSKLEYLFSFIDHGDLKRLAGSPRVVYLLFTGRL